jgi:hypothetical protein
MSQSGEIATQFILKNRAINIVLFLVLRVKSVMKYLLIRVVTFRRSVVKIVWVCIVKVVRYIGVWVGGER